MVQEECENRDISVKACHKNFLKIDWNCSKDGRDDG
jgi:hypothetical protein